jgi:Ribbon-helix-helix protein, copG family
VVDVRTTVTLDADVAAAVERLRREQGIGLSEAINALIRAGLAVPAQRRRFRQRSADLGLRMDVSNIGEALDLLEGPDHR